MPAELKNVSSAVYDGESGDEKTDDKLSPYSSWRRRRLSGLLWQMTFFYGLLICVLLILLSIWTSYAILHITIQGVLLTSLQIVAALLIVIGVFALFFLTLYLLRPLRRASDAAQAITLGDLQQRERLLPLMKGDDEVSRIATSLSIMGEQLERAKKVQQSSEQRFRRFISDASHQLRTPLTSIRGFTEVLMRGAKDDPETALRVNLALEGVERAKELATDGRKIGIYFSTHERLNIQANADQLKQVLHILFDNAIKYGRPAPDGWIRLQLDCQDGYAIIQVIDNGKGIHPDDLPYIFERFYRGEHMSTYASPWKVPQGTGLGLSIARAIALAHEGTITVASTPEIETIFTVKIPRVTE